MGSRATSLPILTRMVSSGAGVTLLPTIALPTETHRSQLSIRRLERPVPFRILVLGCRSLSVTVHRMVTNTAKRRMFGHTLTVYLPTYFLSTS